MTVLTALLSQGYNARVGLAPKLTDAEIAAVLSADPELLNAARVYRSQLEGNGLQRCIIQRTYRAVLDAALPLVQP